MYRRSVITHGELHDDGEYDQWANLLVLDSGQEARVFPQVGGAAIGGRLSRPQTSVLVGPREGRRPCGRQSLRRAHLGMARGGVWGGGGGFGGRSLLGFKGDGARPWTAQ